MLAKYFSFIRNYALSVLFAKKIHFLPPEHTSQMNSRNIIGRNPSMGIPLLANQDLTPMLGGSQDHRVVTSNATETLESLAIQ